MVFTARGTNTSRDLGRPTSEHRLSDCPNHGLNEHPHPTRHRHCNGGEVEQSEQADTHDHSSLTAPRGIILIAVAMTPALRVNYGTGLLCIHYVPNVGAFFLLNQFPEPLQLHIALGN